MKYLSIVWIAALAALPAAAAQPTAVRAVAVPAAAPRSVNVHSAVPAAPVPGITMHSAVPAAPASDVNQTAAHSRPSLNLPAPANRSVVGVPQYHPMTTSPAHAAIVSAPNAYRERSGVVLNPVVYGNAWGWNHGIVWLPQGRYWGGAFWGPFGPGAATTAEIMGSIIHGNQTYPSYGVAPGSPGATLLSNYGLRQVRCGIPGLVTIYGPNVGVVCAYPTYRVGAGEYDVNLNSLTLQSR